MLDQLALFLLPERKWMKTSILQLFLKRLDHGIAQLLRGYFCGDLCVIVLGVIIAPFVVFIPVDLSDMVLLRNGCPCGNLFGKLGCLFPPTRVNAKKDFTVSDFDNETITILKSEQGVHDTKMAVNIRHTESERRNIERSR